MHAPPTRTTTGFTSGDAPPGTTPAATAGDVGPNPVPNNAISSPASAGRDPRTTLGKLINPPRASTAAGKTLLPELPIWNSAGAQFKAGRDMTCYLGDPDVNYAMTAASFGVEGETVAEPAQIKPALDRAAAPAPAAKLLQLHRFNNQLSIRLAFLL